MSAIYTHYNNSRCSPVVWCEVTAGHSQWKESWWTVFREELLHKLPNIKTKVLIPGEALRVRIDFSNDLDHKTEEDLSVNPYTDKRHALKKYQS